LRPGACLRPIPAQELLQLPAVAERLGASRAGSGETARQVAEGQTRWDIGAANVLVKETGIKAVTRPHRVYRLHARR
jgi:hypothetical protein